MNIYPVNIKLRKLEALLPFLLLVFLSIPFSTYSQIVVTIPFPSCNANSTYNQNGTLNGKPRYLGSQEFPYEIIWTGTRWECRFVNNTALRFFNTSNTQKPPCGEWANDGPCSNPYITIISVDGVSCCTDNDGDGAGSMSCGGTDCNDNDPLEKPGQTWYADTDNDGYSNGSTLTQCFRPGGYKVASELTATTGDCNDSNPNINPTATETCNGIDDNCNGMTDEGATPNTYYRDVDGDGFGNSAVTQQGCSQPGGYVANNTDCNDNSALEKPGQVWYKDADGDSYAQTGAATVTQCQRPSGYKAASELTSTSGDCNDGNPAVNPGVSEVCDGVDNNCNSMTDEGALAIFYRDMDSDGFGNPSVTTQACSAPPGYVTNNTDCDDTNGAINPNTIWYLDADNDNYYTGNGNAQCTSPGAGYKNTGLAGGSDCNDADNTIYPTAPDICDSKDNNCNGTTDEGGMGTPPGWGAGNVGGATNANSQFDCNSGSGGNMVFNITSQGFSGAGNADLVNSNYQQKCGNASITAHIVGNPSPGWAGIYIREDLSAGSKMVALKTNLSSFIKREVRSSTNGNKTTTQNPLYAGNTWVRIERTGNTFSFYTSPNGTAWTFFGSATVAMNSCVYLGLFAESINGATPINASFDNVTITGGPAPLAAAPGLGFEVQESTPTLLSPAVAPTVGGAKEGILTLILYPNPTPGIIKIEFAPTSGYDDTCIYRVFDAQGKVVLEGSDLRNGIDLSFYPDGLYWLCLQPGDAAPLLQKIIKTSALRP